MANQKFKVKVVNKSKPELARRWFNYDIAISPAAKNGGWVIEDPELDEKLKANGHEPIGEISKKKESEVKEKKKEAGKSTTDQVKEKLEDQEKDKVEDNDKAPDYNNMKFPELREAAKAKGINTFGKKKTVIIEELKN